jgi:hypothetical protein
LLRFSSNDRWQMDRGEKEETYEYYRAKLLQRNEWSEADEYYYEKESDPKIPLKRIEPLLRFSSNDRWQMDRGEKEETYEYYQVKKIMKYEEFLYEENWTKMKEWEKNRPIEAISRIPKSDSVNCHEF